MVEFLRDHAKRLPKRNGPLSVSPEIQEVADYIENIYMPNDESAKFSPEQIGSIVGAYTGILCGDFGSLHRYIEQLLGRPVWTYEMADADLMTKVKELAKPDFLKLSKYCGYVEPAAKHES